MTIYRRRDTRREPTLETMMITECMKVKIVQCEIKCDRLRMRRCFWMIQDTNETH